MFLCNQMIENDGDKVQLPFNLIKHPLAQPIVVNLIDHCLKHSKMIDKLSNMQTCELTTLSMIDTLMRQCSTKALVETIEDLLPKLFGCERVVVVLCHRMQKYLFRIEPDATGTDSYVKHEFIGYAGLVAGSGKMLITEDALSKDPNWISNVDDPTFLPGSKLNPAN